MAGGVPIKAPVAGIAMESDQMETTIRWQISRFGEHFGDMDFKVAGTRSGYSQLQMISKIQGITAEILTGSACSSLKARFEILDVTEATIPEVKVQN